MAGFCAVCGHYLPGGGPPRSWVGQRMFCPPDGSPCHQLGQRAAGWTLSPVDAAALAADDAVRAAARAA